MAGHHLSLDYISISDNLVRTVIIGDRIRAFREERNLSQSDLQQMTGLHPAYISRVENGRTVPQVGSLERLAKSLRIPISALLYDGDEPRQSDEALWGHWGKERRTLRKFRRLFARMSERNRRLLLATAREMADTQNE